MARGSIDNRDQDEEVLACSFDLKGGSNGFIVVFPSVKDTNPTFQSTECGVETKWAPFKRAAKEMMPSEKQQISIKIRKWKKLLRKGVENIKECDGDVLAIPEKARCKCLVAERRVELQEMRRFRTLWGEVYWEMGEEGIFDWPSLELGKHI